MNFLHCPHVSSAIQHSHKIIFDNEDYLLIHCTESNVYVAECRRGTEEAFAQNILKLSVIRLQTSNQKLQQLLIPHFKHNYECQQAVFAEQTSGLEASKLQLIHSEDVEFAGETYEMPEYMHQLYSRNRLFGYYDDEKLVGYVAFHIDETVGVLYVKPEYRRQGFGEKIMAAAASLYQKENPGCTCFAQILTDNTSSIKLHQKLGCQFSEPIYWVYNEEYFYQQRPLFHFSTPVGWCNDPNGFSVFQNKVHLFFQHYPEDTKWGPMHWGHAVSNDLLTWDFLPIALAPDTPGADEIGCFSGTAIEEDGRHIIAYTGVTRVDGKDIQNQCIAIGDGVYYKKLEMNPVLDNGDIPFCYNREHFRDPKLWKKDDLYYMACVIKQENDKGALILFSSSDLKSWNYKGMLDSSKDDLSNMWECPDVFNLDGKDFLVLSPQEMKEDFDRGFHNGNNSVYITGQLDYENGAFTRETRTENDYTAAQIDYGIDFYAPETTKLSDGRTIMIAWMQAWESYITPPTYTWSGMMTLPRELSYKNGRLYQKPVRELAMWRKDLESGSVAGGKESILVKNRERHFELQLEVPVLQVAEGSLSIKIGNENEFVLLELDLKNSTISFDRTKSLTPGAIPERKAKIFARKVINMSLILDTISAELFISDGELAFTNTFFLSSERSDIILRNESLGDVKFNLWELGK